MNSRTLPFTLVESDEPSILNVDQLYRQAAPLIDRRTARGLRSPRALIVTVAVLAKRAGSTRVEEVADWAKLRRRELRVLFGAKQPQMPHHTIWSRMLDLAENGGDYLWLVDANQPTLRAERALRFDPAGVTAGWSAPPVDFTTARTVDTGHGCSEARILPASRRLAGRMRLAVCGPGLPVGVPRDGAPDGGGDDGGARRGAACSRHGVGCDRRVDRDP
jgi:hypothetical protein